MAMVQDPVGRFLRSFAQTANVVRKIETLEPRRLFAAGARDVNFDVDGANFTDFVATNEHLGIAQRPNGSYVVVGAFAANGDDKQAGILQFNNNGTLDTTFGNGGIHLFEPFGSLDDVATDVALDLDGNAYVSGVSGTFADLSAKGWVYKVNVNGQKVNGFGANGLLEVPAGTGQAIAMAAIEVVGGSLITAGTLATNAQAGTHLVKANLNGVLDTSFGINGMITYPLAGRFNGALDLKVRANGKIVTAGYEIVFSNSTVLGRIAQYDSNGNVDIFFAPATGGFGRQTVSFNNSVSLFTSVAVNESSGEIFTAGVTGNGLPAGLLPPGLPADFANPPVAIPAATASDMAVVKWDSTGTAVAGFGASGQAVIAIPGTIAAASEVILQADQNIIIGGAAKALDGSSDHVTARLNRTTGALDTTWGSSGTGIFVDDVRPPAGATSDGAFAGITDKDGFAVFVGYSAASNVGSIVRYLEEAGTPVSPPVPPATPTAKQTISGATLTGLPATIVGGAADAKGKVSVSILNDGTKKSAKKITADIYLSLDGALDGNDIKIGSKGANLKINPAAIKALLVKVKLPEVLADSVFNLITVITGADAPGAEPLVLPDPITVAARTVDLVGSPTPQSAIDAAFGRKKAVKFDLSGNGNSLAKARAVFDFFIADDVNGANVLVTGDQLADATAGISIAPGVTKTVKVIFTVPVAGGTLQPNVEYFLFVVLKDAATSVSNQSNGDVVAIIPFTIPA